MILRTAAIIDVTNLYFETQTVHPGKRLRLLEYTKALEAVGHVLTFKIAYSRQSPDAAQSFMHMLTCNGFETHFGMKPWNVAMALRAAQILPNVDAFVLGSSVDEMGRILQYAKELGKLTKCFAVNIPAGFSHWAECVELPESVFDEAPKKTKQLAIPGLPGTPEALQ